MIIETISYQGIPGSFSYQACKEFFKLKGFSVKDSSSFLGVDTFQKLFENVKQSQSSFSIIPIENSTAGSIIENYDYLRTYQPKICGEISLNVKHQFAGIKSSKVSKIKKIYSHPKAFDQCRIFLSNYPNIELINYSDTAGSAKLVNKLNDPSIGAICSFDASKLYDLEVLQKDIHDTEINTTRFVIVQNKEHYIDSGDKCSLIFELPHTPGSLYKVFEILDSHKINITKIESRPNYQRKFEYFFFLDFEFNAESQNKKLLILKIQKVVHRAIELGWYKIFC